MYLFLHYIIQPRPNLTEVNVNIEIYEKER